MANKITNTDNYTAIANAIRTKNGSSDTYTPSQMATAISNIPTGYTLPYNTKFGCNSTVNIKKIFYTDRYDTSNYTDMSKMFAYCCTGPDYGSGSEGYTFYLSRLNTSNVTDMSYMFQGNDCIKFWSLTGFSNWDTSKVTNMSYMFYNTNKYIDTTYQTYDFNLDLSHFDVSEVTNMYAMFMNAKNLTSLDISTWYTPKVANIGRMFNGCTGRNLNLDLSHFNVSSLTPGGASLYHMFEESSFASLTIDGWEFSTGDFGFKSWLYKANIPSITIKNFKVNGNVELGGSSNSDGMFSTCSYTTSIDLSGWSVNSISNTSKMFYKCTSLQNLDISGFDLTSITTYTDMFGGTSSSYRVPYNCAILVKDQASKDWMTSNFSSYTNVQIKQ